MLTERHLSRLNKKSLCLILGLDHYRFIAMTWKKTEPSSGLACSSKWVSAWPFFFIWKKGWLTCTYPAHVLRLKMMLLAYWSNYLTKRLEFEIMIRTNRNCNRRRFVIERSSGVTEFSFRIDQGYAWSDSRIWKCS